jgi:hypothetical protein
MTSRHLIVALAATSWGRTIMARGIADQLTAMGDEVVFLANESLTPLLCDGKFELESISRQAGPLMGMYFQHVIAENAPDSVVLGDYFSNANFLHDAGVNPAHMLLNDIPTFTLDVWDCRQTGFEIDIFMDGSRQLGPGSMQERSEQFSAIPHKLKPVPIIAPAASSGEFCNLPPTLNPSAQNREWWRSTLGLKETSKAVLFCTAEWQHAQYESDAANQMIRWLPDLMSDYLSRLGEDVHLVHVGPQAYDLKEHLDGRYHWMASLAPAKFDQLLAAMDLLLSANISATTIAKAMVYEVPVLVLQNSISAASREEAEASLPEPASRAMRKWLEKVVPLFPFALWPLGYHRFLAPLLRDNPYVAALQMVELLHEREVEAALSALLFDSVARENQAHRQANYLAQVRALPTGAQLIKACLGG